jgi:molybdopterin-guanine dinucleotide biosynthesis protein A
MPESYQSAYRDVVWIGVVLAGGAGRRLGGRHKPGITVAGRTLLDHVLDAVAAADRVVVVGPRQPTGRGCPKLG